MTDISFRRVQVGEVTLHFAEAGPRHGRPVVLLHGFPDFWYGWKHQIAALSEAGYRVLAPDQRGYDLSDKPRRIKDYTLDSLASDIVGLIRSQGYAKASVVGHDWGGAVTWWLVQNHPDVVERACILNAPHPADLFRHTKNDPRQLARSWYIFFFQFPLLPERLFTSRFLRLGERALVSGARQGTFSKEDLEQYAEAWRRPGAARGMINWYRAVFRKPARSSRKDIEVKLLLLWGKKDKYLGIEVAESSLERCKDARMVTLPEAGHWIQLEEPKRVNEELLAFLAE